MFKIGVFAIITDNQGRVLLCHRRDHDLWNLPGGGVETGESPWDAQIPKNTSPKQVERIKEYFADKSKTHYRVQTGPSSIDLIKEGKL